MEDPAVDHVLAQIRESLETAGEPWWEWDLARNLVSFSDRKVTMLGYSVEDWQDIGYQAFTGLLHPDDYERTMQHMRDYLSGVASIYQTDYRIRRADGSYTWYMDRGYAIEKALDGSPKLLRGLVFDFGTGYERGEYDNLVFQAIRSVIPQASRADAQAQADLLTVCSVCLSVKFPEETWVAVSDRLPEIVPERVSHGICPTCIDVLYPEYRKLKGGRK